MAVQDPFWEGGGGLTAGVNGEVVQAAVLVTAVAIVSGYYYH